MIDEKELKEFVRRWNMGLIETIPDAADMFQDITDTLSAALKVVRVSQEVCDVIPTNSLWKTQLDPLRESLSPFQEKPSVQRKTFKKCDEEGHYQWCYCFEEKSEKGA